MSYEPEGQRPRRFPRSRGTGVDADRQTILLRRAVAAGAGVLILLLLILGVKGCLNARKDQAFKDYATDVRGVIDQSNGVSKQVFEVLTNPKGADALDVRNQISARSTDAEQLVEQAEETDHPDELNDAQEWVVTALEFRSDALNRIVNEIPAALGEKDRQPAIDAIAGQMQAFLASDVIYSQRAIPDLRRGFQARDIRPQFPPSNFLPNLGWLEPDTVEARLGKIGNLQKAATPGLHGSGLQGASVAPSGTALSEDGVNRIPVSGRLSFDVKVQNQGESEETDVGVSVTIRNGKQISVDQTINRIEAGEVQTVSIPISGSPSTGAVNKVTIDVTPVPGEKVTDNNKATYQVVFTK